MTIQIRRFKSLTSIRQSLSRDTRGNVAMLFGVALPALIGAAGLGVDTAQWYTWKREMQYAVDQAALSGAFSLSKGKAFNVAQARVLSELESNQQIVQFAGTPQVALASYASKPDNSIIVNMSASRSLPFSGSFLSEPVTVAVSAQAAFSTISSTSTSEFDSCFIATNLTASQTLMVNGNATLNLGCGLAALSTASDAIWIGSNADITGITSLVSAGGVVLNGASNTEANQDLIEDYVTGLSDPFEGTPEPTGYNASSTASISCTSGNKTFQPGTYTDISITANCKATFAPGIYFVKGGTVHIAGNNNSTVTGIGVMFVLKAGANLSYNGTGTSSLTAPTEAQLNNWGQAPAASVKLKGVLVYQDPNDTSGSGKEITINGNSKLTLGGAIYGKQATTKINGNSNASTHCIMVVTDKIQITGTTNLQNMCPSNVALQRRLERAVDSGAVVSRVFLVS
jgi:predicted outer membrane repeat protein